MSVILIKICAMFFKGDIVESVKF